MFKEQNFDAVGFDSSWKNEKLVEDQSLQTTDFSIKNQGTSTTIQNSMQTQTEPLTNNVDENNVDMEKLAKWLKSCYQEIEGELNDTSLTNAMAACKSLDKMIPATVTVLQELNTTADKNEVMYISALSWNCTGNTIAVSRSFKHDIWCYHQGEVRLYCFDRNDKLPEVPIKKLMCGACVTSLAYHPTQPSVLCAGTVSGEILLWNTQNDGDSLLASYTGHDDRISLVAWISTTDTKPSTVLVTAALDSNLILWKIHDHTLNIEQKYKVQHFTNKRYTGSPDMIPKKTERGIVHFDFSPHVPGLFVLGMEGGFVLKCCLLGARLVPGDKTLPSVLDPYISSFNSHEGEVNVISFSPHRKELFFSSGTDDQIRIYHIEQESPVQIIFVDISLNSVAWIMCESKLLIGIGEDGSLRLYSLLNGQQIPNNTTSINQPLTSLAVNNKRLNMLAVGNNEGTLKLWSVPWNDIASQDQFNIHKN